jgi:hypothetical protein
MFAQGIQAAIFDALKQVWMALTMSKQFPRKTTTPRRRIAHNHESCSTNTYTALPQLHDNIQNRRPIFARVLTYNAINIAKQQLLIQLLLHPGHADIDDCFCFRW